MKKILFLLVFVHLISCSSYNGIKMLGTGKRCFSNKDFKSIIESQLSKNPNKASQLIINKKVADKNSCIGLYEYIFSNTNVTARSLKKILKFEDKIYLFSANNLPANQAALNEFIEKYKTKFTKQELDKLIESFNKGTESNVRYY